MTTPNIKPVVQPTSKTSTTPSRTRRVGRGIASGLKAFGAAVVVVAEAEAARQREINEIDRQIDALEALRIQRTGRGHITLQRGWSLVNDGHLITCPKNCTWRHCPNCGDRVLSSTYVRCVSCR